jgi:hypothetical protein
MLSQLAPERRHGPPGDAAGSNGRRSAGTVTLRAQVTGDDKNPSNGAKLAVPRRRRGLHAVTFHACQFISLEG